MAPFERRSKPRSQKKLRLSLFIFLVGLLLSFVAWDHYLNSPDPIDRDVACHLVLLSGFLFSCLAGFVVWTLESKTDLLEREIEARAMEILRHESEKKVMDAASVAVCWLSQLVLSDQKDENLFDSVIHLVKKVLQADDVSLMVMNEDQELYIAAASGLSEEIIAKTRVKVGERIAGRAAACRREFLLVGSLSNYPEFKGIKDNARITSSIVCPLMNCSEVLGVLNLNRTVTAEPFSEIHLRHALIISSLIAQVIWNEKVSHSLSSKETALEAAYQKLRSMGVSL
jgi:transcriptional regulator with GAF, ATPase, and Fis domain